MTPDCIPAGAALPESEARLLAAQSALRESEARALRVEAALRESEARALRAEAALRESEARFLEVADAAPVLIWISDATKKCIWFNKPWLAFTGRSMEQDMGVGWVDGVHPDDIDVCVAVYDEAFERRERYRTEYRRRRHDGQWRVLDATGVPRFCDGEFAGFIGSCIDVTDQRAADRALTESEEQLRLATEAAEVGLWDLDVASATLFWPPRVKAMFGISADVPVSVADYVSGVHPEDRAATMAAYAAALDPARRARYDVEYRTIGREDGVIRWVASKGRGLFNGDRCVRLIGAAIDITARKTAEERLRVLNESLEQRVAEALAERKEAEEHLRQVQKLDALGQLTGGVAHDFNNLLMVISGGLSLIERCTDANRRERIIAGMRQAADRGASLSRQLLAFARRQPLKPESLDLRRQIAGMRDLLDRTLRGDVQVKTELADALWPIKVDRAELELVMLNLCVNARDAMPSGGIITIRAHNAAAVHDGDLSGDFVVVTVEDTGTGMSAQVLTRIFEPFFTTKQIGQGSGLGLPQVHGFVHQSGGAVRVASAIGRGTTVTLFLPRTLEPPAYMPPEPADLAVGTKSVALAGSVLLVEDDDEVAALVTEMLQELGYRVTRAASAESALGALANGREVDLVLSDIMMPGAMNGLGLARELRLRRPGLPVLLTSGYAGAVIDSAQEEHIGVLRKPYDLDQLHKALRACERISEGAARPMYRTGPAAR